MILDASRLARALSELVRLPAVDGMLAAETPLLDGGIALTSVQVLELVVLLEERFAVELEPDDVVPANLATFGSLCALVSARMAHSPGVNAA